MPRYIHSIGSAVSIGETRKTDEGCILVVGSSDPTKVIFVDSAGGPSRGACRVIHVSARLQHSV